MEVCSQVMVELELQILSQLDYPYIQEGARLNIMINGFFGVEDQKYPL